MMLFRTNGDDCARHFGRPALSALARPLRGGEMQEVLRRGGEMQEVPHKYAEHKLAAHSADTDGSADSKHAGDSRRRE